VAAPGLRFASGQRNIHVPELVHGKCLADDFDPSQLTEDHTQPILRHAEDFDVEVLRCAAEQSIADEAADNQRASAVALHQLGDVDGLGEDVGAHATIVLRRARVPKGGRRCMAPSPSTAIDVAVGVTLVRLLRVVGGVMLAARPMLASTTLAALVAAALPIAVVAQPRGAAGECLDVIHHHIRPLR
jgi:hypothetical protein